MPKAQDNPERKRAPSPAPAVNIPREYLRKEIDNVICLVKIACLPLCIHIIILLRRVTEWCTIQLRDPVGQANHKDLRTMWKEEFSYSKVQELLFLALYVYMRLLFINTVFDFVFLACGCFASLAIYFKFAMRVLSLWKF